jgi:hypothetical protein
MSDDRIRMSAWEDQHDAAVEQAESMIREMGSLGREDDQTRVVDSPFHRTFLGSRFKWMRSVRAFKAADLRGCRHVDLTSPRPWFVNLHEPRRVLCAPCALLVAEMDRDMRPDVCDHCGAGSVAEFHEIVVQAGNFIIVGNVCPGCYRGQMGSVGRR